MFYNVAKIASYDSRQLLLIKGTDNIPLVSVYDEHSGQTLMRACESNFDNMKHALWVLETGDNNG
jgi:hypothetical protein